jgi:hypothetical protein
MVMEAERRQLLAGEINADHACGTVCDALFPDRPRGAPLTADQFEVLQRDERYAAARGQFKELCDRRCSIEDEMLKTPASTSEGVLTQLDILVLAYADGPDEPIRVARSTIAAGIAALAGQSPAQR